MRIIDWLNLNSYRRYPLTDDCDYSLTGPTSTIMTNDVLLDFKCVDYLHADYTITFSSFEIVTGSPGVFRAYFTLTDSTGSIIFSFDIPANAAFPYHTVKTIAGQYRVGIWFGSGITKFTVLTAGVYVFPVPPQILKTLLITQKNCRINNVIGTTVTSVIIDDVIYMEEGANISISLNMATNTMYIGAIPGAGSGLSCEVLANSRVAGDFVSMINGLKPGPDGNINIFAGNGFEIIPDKVNHKLIIKTTIDTNRIFCGK